MAKLLHIQSSPRAERSASIAVAKHFLEVYRDSHPNDEVETFDLWQMTLPEFNGEVLNAKYAILHGQSHTPEQAKAWQAVMEVIERFLSADKYLFSVPMWNFSIPYKLKHFIDLLVQPGLTFRFSPETGYQGLVIDKPAAVIYARGGAYGPGTGAESYDAQSAYLRQCLGFIGVTQIQEIFVEPTLASATSKNEAVAKGFEKATLVAAVF